MPISKLAHFSVRTTALEKSKRFYSDILGLKEGYRPPFEFPGAWLYRGGDEADFGVVHLISVDSDNPAQLQRYLGEKKVDALIGSAAIDHLAFLASDLVGMLARLRVSETAFRERTVPSLGLHQVFVEDPSGVTIELNFPADEAASLYEMPSVAPERTR